MFVFYCYSWIWSSCMSNECCRVQCVLQSLWINMGWLWLWLWLLIVTLTIRTSLSLLTFCYFKLLPSLFQHFPTSLLHCCSLSLQSWPHTSLLLHSFFPSTYVPPLTLLHTSLLSCSPPSPHPTPAGCRPGTGLPQAGCPQLLPWVGLWCLPPSTASAEGAGLTAQALHSAV